LEDLDLVGLAVGAGGLDGRLGRGHRREGEEEKGGSAHDDKIAACGGGRV
jgi:hypothetical protein